jgi:hypothetical protein
MDVASEIVSGKTLTAAELTRVPQVRRAARPDLICNDMLRGVDNRRISSGAVLLISLPAPCRLMPYLCPDAGLFVWHQTPGS